jgi:hypothetical protein
VAGALSNLTKVRAQSVLQAQAGYVWAPDAGGAIRPTLWLAGEWDPSQYHDSFTAELRAVIAEKAAGHELLEEPEGGTEERGQLVDLMAALQASVAAAKRPRGAPDVDTDDDTDEVAEDRTA